MTPDNSSPRPDLNFRQTIEGMPLIFNPAAAGHLQATIQFNAGGREPGVYYLKIESGDCTFHRGAVLNPSLTINTPSEVWLQISSGFMSGQDALLKGLYTIEGDTALLLRLGELFKTPENFSVNETTEPPKGQLFSILQRKSRQTELSNPAGKRPAGPILVSGMLWMTLFFIPWTLFWIMFDIHAINPWISSGIPLILMTLIILYRVVFNRPVWAEIVSWVFFLVATGLAAVVQYNVFLTWGSVIGSLVMAGMWLISLTPSFKLPFCAEYSRWGFVRKLCVNSMFIQPNMAISLVWGWQFIIATGFGIAAQMLPPLFIPFTAIRYLLLIPAAIFTTRYQKGIMDRKFKDVDKTMSALRIWAYVGLAIAVLMLISVWFVLRPPA